MKKLFMILLLFLSLSSLVVILAGDGKTDAEFEEVCCVGVLKIVEQYYVQNQIQHKEKYGFYADNKDLVEFSKDIILPGYQSRFDNIANKYKIKTGIDIQDENNFLKLCGKFDTSDNKCDAYRTGFPKF